MRNRKRILIDVLIIVAIAGGVQAVRYLPGVVPYWQSSEVYKQFSKVEGVRSTFVKDFPVNDTLRVSVTLLEAADSAGWEYLKQKFYMSASTIKLAEANPMLDIWEWQIVKGHPETRYVSSGDKDGDTVKTEIVSTSFSKQEVCIFHIRNEQEWDAVVRYRLRLNCKTNKL